MSGVKNILFIMADQLRADYLSCYGHPRLQTPAIDALARRGVLFSHAYVNATVCGPSRMCYYTGRHMSSHGSTWNGVPLRVGEPTLGGHLRALGMRVALVGKTHMVADRPGLAQLGVGNNSIEGVYAREAGFEPYERDDGLHPDSWLNPELAYNRYLRERGYNEPNPWHTAANSAAGPSGEILSGWYMRNSSRPARVAEEDSETAYMTDRAMDFIAEADDAPWCLHLSYIKPHWPYIAPAPYSSMFGPEDIIAANRSEAEKAAAHPVYAAYMQHAESRAFSREEVRCAVIPTYMGLIRQLDDHIGRLMAFLASRDLTDKTMIVICSDHGDYLGDHWLGDKELFHDESVRVPLIVFDPDPAADAARGSVNSALVQSIDLAPTFVEAIGGGGLDHILEGQSLLPLLRGVSFEGHEFIVSELDYSFRAARLDVNAPPDRARAYMVRSAAWKYVWFEGFRPQLFDLTSDPRELVDRGDDPSLAAVREEHRERLFVWLRNRRMRITVANADVAAGAESHVNHGILIGKW